ncbi:MAG TPA: MFS transporter [Mucilaginibacter sp.]|jgi:ACS family hexuronate transporter-like MFS transporter
MKTNQPGNYRWIVCALLFFATTVNYLDRQIIGLLKPILAEKFHWSEIDYKNIVQAFQACYAIGLLVFGRVVDKIGTKMGYIASIIIWSVSAMAHALVRTTLGFGIVRGALGLGESGNFPTAIKVVAEWFPKKERATATGIFNSGANIGAVVAPILVPFILGIYGWQMAFIITGAIGFVWLVFWIIFYEIPSKQKRLSAAEYELIHSDIDEVAVNAADEKQIGWGQLLKYRQTWFFIFGKLLTDPVWWFFLFWLPSYFASTFNLDLTKPSLPLVIVYSASTVGSVGGGYLSSWFIKRGWPVFKARKIAMLLFAICVVPIVAAKYAVGIWQAVALISLAVAAHQAWSANIFTTASDMFPKRAISSVVGIGSMAGALGGFLFPDFIGYILQTNKDAGHILVGYNIIFATCGGAYLLAWVVMHFLAPKMKPVNLAD